ncbi:hypothetical protein [Bacillus sp. FJAT-49736]|uniref:hypothetical protein n=1 Tax=Bacillus sp. FJAT-49736 TaxID=2833582 RepID=UPI001BC91AA8|nr:hypothetical protein [Bacillus sp. FJAT-49736]MBS4174737.1 hypothetical protein [Bacillus sp. FJAT-49736]
MNFAPVEINLQYFKLNAVDHAAVVNMGPSQHIDLFVSYKRNQGTGELNGDLSPVFFPITTCIDSDYIDTPSVKNSIL